MDIKLKVNRYCLRGGLIGAAAPVILFGLFLLLNNFGIAFGENPLTALLIFALALIELPTAIIGGTLGLPMGTGGAAFLIYDFNALGYVLTIMFWVFVGVLFGLIISRKA